MDVESALATYRKFEELLRAAGTPLADQMAPPHRAPQDALNDALPGSVLPHELSAWWGWHNGATAVAGWDFPLTGTGWAFLSLEAALERREYYLEIAASIAEPDLPAERFWPPSWLPIVSGQDATLALDLAAATSDHSPIYFVHSASMADNSPLASHSWPEIVQWWCTLLQAGATRWDPTVGVGQWATAESLVPTELLGNPIAYPSHPTTYQPRFRPVSDF